MVHLVAWQAWQWTGTLVGLSEQSMPEGKAGFFPTLERDMCEHVKITLFGVYISSWLCRQAVIDRVLGMSCSEMGHTLYISKGKDLNLQDRLVFSVCGHLASSDEAVLCFLGEQKAFSNTGQPFKTSWYLLVLWNGVEQGQVFVAKLNLRWSLWGQKQALWISIPVECPLCVLVCEVVAV